MDYVLYTLAAGPVATNVYLLVHPDTRSAICIDAPSDCRTWVMEHLEKHDCRLTHLLLTHTHWDHTADAAPIVRDTQATVYVHPDDSYRLVDPMAHTIWPLPFQIEPVTEFETLSEGDELTLQGATFKVIHTPGHTEGGVCFIDHENRRVFAGDTLFAGSIGRADLPGGDMELLLKSIRERLLTLPGDYVVWPGHGPATTIGEEILSNPYVGVNADDTTQW